MRRMDKKLGERLRQARQGAGLKQKQLASRSGVSQKTISKIEIGKQHKSTQMLRLAAACGVRPEWLSSGEEPMKAVAEGTASAPASYNVLSTTALALARLWDEAPVATKEAVQQTLVFDSVMRELLDPRELTMRPKEFISEYRDRLIQTLQRGRGRQ